MFCADENATPCTVTPSCIPTIDKTDADKHKLKVVVSLEATNPHCLFPDSYVI